jgi:hypothetical protein
MRWMFGGCVALFLITGISILTIGIFLGTMTVLGMWLTVEQIPGVRSLARTKVGQVLLSVGAAFLVHLLLGTSTATGMIAAATALVLKYFLLQLEGEREQRGGPVIYTHLVPA